MRLAFTLLELLVVILVLAIVAGMAFSVSRGDRREADVKAAAMEMAGVFREARGRAMATHSVVGVVFHIQNGPGSSGLVLNNRSGGHWYRTIGPRPDDNRNGESLTNLPPLFDRTVSSLDGTNTEPANDRDNPIRPFIESVEASWVEKPHHLAKGRVRFLALTDTDNANFSTSGCTFGPTYPRPWFGWWEQSTGRLHTWGGYDPGIAMVDQPGAPQSYRYKAKTLGARTISHSGFFFEGYDGVVTGCVNPSDRNVVDDTNGDGKISSKGVDPLTNDDLTKRYRLWSAGDPRPLINGQWEDCMLLFLPDGRVTHSWMVLRHEYNRWYWAFDAWRQYLFYDPTLNGTAITFAAAAGSFPLVELGIGDRCNRVMEIDRMVDQWQGGDYGEGTWQVERSGFYWISIAPDVAKDVADFPDADAALKTVTPCYRIGVSRYGEVKIVRVRTTLEAGRVYDTTLVGTAWNTPATIKANYQRNQLTAANGAPLGSPIIDTVTTRMLTDRIMWWQ